MKRVQRLRQKYKLKPQLRWTSSGGDKYAETEHGRYRISGIKAGNRLTHDLSFAPKSGVPDVEFRPSVGTRFSDPSWRHLQPDEDGGYLLSVKHSLHGGTTIPKVYQHLMTIAERHHRGLSGEIGADIDNRTTQSRARRGVKPEMEREGKALDWVKYRTPRLRGGTTRRLTLGHGTYTLYEATENPKNPNLFSLYYASHQGRQSERLRHGITLRQAESLVASHDRVESSPVVQRNRQLPAKGSQADRERG